MAMANVAIVLGGGLIVAIAGCGGTPAGDPAFWRPWYEPAAVSAGDEAAQEPDPGTGGGAIPGGSPTTTSTPPPPESPTPTPTGMTPTPTPANACGLAISVTTASFGGTYAPNNIGSIWIADDHSRFVKSLDVWADRRTEHLDHWVAATAAAGLPNNRLDAVSTATKTSHGTRTAAWNCTDATRAPVPDGNYRVCFELTESNGAGPLDCVAFAKGTAAQDLSPADLPTFKKRRLVFTP